MERDVLPGESPSFVRSCNAAGERICGACLLPLEPDDKVGATDNCTHIFHYECVEKWSQTENSCPQCKVRFFWMAAYGSDHQRQSLMKVESKDQEEQEEEEFEEVSICEKCKEVGDEAKLLLCDGMHGTCNATFHYTCVGLSGVPRGSWFCPDCTERGFDIDARGRRGPRRAGSVPASAPERTVEVPAPAAMPPPLEAAAAAPVAPVPAPVALAGGAPSAPSGAPASESSRTRPRLPSQLQLSSLACLTPAVEVPTFQARPAGPARGHAPAGLFATFAARRRAKKDAAEATASAEEKGSFISLNPTYEEDFMANQKAGG